MAKRKFTIDRSKWVNGSHRIESPGYIEPTYLRNDKDRYCCIGLDLMSLGINPDRLTGRGTPEDLHFNMSEVEELGISHLIHKPLDSCINTRLAVRLMNANDQGSPIGFDTVLSDVYSHPWDKEHREITSEEREKLIIDLYATADIEVEFEGEYL
jgi:hypothetical protein